MASYLHLLKADAAPLAAAGIAASRAEPGAAVTVVLLDDGPAPPLPEGVRLRRLGAGDLDYAGLVDLIFDHDHVVAW
jgi:hypothetical protein